MKHLDLFSGIGGFALASSWVWGDEYENVGHSEVEPYACKVYHRHFPESECLGDITKIKWTEGQADLITGGFPCQPHSVAGKRKASADSRDLWGECARAVRMVRPRYAVFENVPGLLVSEGGRFFNRVLHDLAEIGYDAEWYTVGAWQVGASHKRDRIWIVAYSRSERRQQIRRSASGDEGADERWTTTHNHIATGCGKAIRHPPIAGLPDWSGGEMGQPWPVTEFERPDGKEGGDVQNPDRSGSKESGVQQSGVSAKPGGSKQGQREIERVFCRMANGLSSPMVGTLPVINRVDRLKGLGNAIVPQVTYVILDAIRRADTMTPCNRNHRADGDCE